METLQWYKWRENHTSGPGEWEIDCITADNSDLIKTYIQEFHIGYDKPQGYIGFECELLDVLPAEFISELLTTYTTTVAHHNRMIEYLNANFLTIRSTLGLPINTTIH